MPIDFSKRFSVVAHDSAQLSKAERQVVEAMGDTTLSIREISAAAKLSVMAVYSTIQKLAEKKVIHELEPAEAKAA
ncbi:MAG: hypothetical protein WBC73_06005 [Phormidesmis sp.]